MKEGVKWTVCNGTDVYFLLDGWILGLKALIHYDKVCIPLMEINYSMASYINHMSKWDILRSRK